MNRKRQTSLLILLTAATLMPAYALQGWLASGHSASELPFWFWVWETVAWSARALIEAGAILYLFQTKAETLQQERALLFFKFALITLITLTLGPVVASAGLGEPLPEALPRALFWLWSFAVASYAPLMLGAVGVAYRIMPHEAATDAPETVAPVAEPAVQPESPQPRNVPEPAPEPVVSAPATPQPEALSEPVTEVEPPEALDSAGVTWADMGTEERRNRIASMRGQEMTWEQIGEAVGASASAVKSWWYRNGTGEVSAGNSVNGANRHG